MPFKLNSTVYEHTQPRRFLLTVLLYCAPYRFVTKVCNTKLIFSSQTGLKNLSNVFFATFSHLHVT
uniref:Uncharacterized protein n=1 Tax=Anguilla anguilla TaxID=7936 RepID=A0A0E9XF84_ANGAN